MFALRGLLILALTAIAQGCEEGFYEGDQGNCYRPTQPLPQAEAVSSCNADTEDFVTGSDADEIKEAQFALLRGMDSRIAWLVWIAGNSPDGCRVQSIRGSPRDRDCGFKYVAICKAKGPENTFLMAVGYGASYGEVEVLDLDSEKECAKLSDYPEKSWGTAGEMTKEGPLVCSGYDSKKCFYYRVEGNTWEEAPFSIRHWDDTKDYALYPASVKLGEDRLLITGGLTDDGNTDSMTDIDLKTGSASIHEKALPREVFDHVQVALNDTHFFLSSGNPKTPDAWIFDSTTNVFHKTAPMARARQAPIAGVVTRADGRKAVVIAGDYSKDLQSASDNTTEIFDVDSGVWTSGPDLPRTMCCSASVQRGQAFLAVGGMDEEADQLDAILEYDRVNDKWVELPQKMKTARETFPAFLVSADYCKYE